LIIVVEFWVLKVLQWEDIEGSSQAGGFLMKELL
jgi:hypothetical protein